MIILSHLTFAPSSRDISENVQFEEKLEKCHIVKYRVQFLKYIFHNRVKAIRVMCILQFADYSSKFRSDSVQCIIECMYVY